MADDHIPPGQSARKAPPDPPVTPPPTTAEGPTSGSVVLARQARIALAVAAVFVGVFVAGYSGFRGSRAAPTQAQEPRPAAPDQHATLVRPAPPPLANPIRAFLEREEAEPGTTPTPAGRPLPASPLAPDVLFAQSSPAVVQVVIQDRQGRTLGSGSGFLVGTIGLVATNYHVVERAHKAHVVLPDKTAVAVLGVAALDKDADIAIIALARRLDAQPLELAGAKLPAVGTKVYAIGNPLGFSNTLSDGLVSGHRELAWGSLIQTSAPISPGSSGGPLLAADGRVVGVTTFMYKGGQNLNFAVPAAQVTRLLGQWKAKKMLTQFPLEPRPGAGGFESVSPPNWAQRKPPASRDDGAFFGQFAWARVAPAAEKLRSRKAVDFVVETIPTPPQADVERVKAMPPAAQEKFFGELSEARARELQLSGVYILVCKNPSLLGVLVTRQDDFPAEFAAKLHSAMLANFRDKKYDEGLQKVIDLTLDAQGLGEGK